MFGCSTSSASFEFFGFSTVTRVWSARPVILVVNRFRAMSDEDRYIPLSERPSQDVSHDNFVPKYHDLFVPKYSALASAGSSKLIVIGVWIIFGPMAFVALMMPLSFWPDAPDLLSAVVSTLIPLALGLIAVAILWTQTRKYLIHARNI